jgi:hypothetical protein
LIKSFSLLIINTSSKKRGYKKVYWNGLMSWCVSKGVTLDLHLEFFFFFKWKWRELNCLKGEYPIFFFFVNQDELYNDMEGFFLLLFLFCISCFLEKIYSEIASLWDSVLIDFKCNAMFLANDDPFCLKVVKRHEYIYICKGYI